MEELYRMCASKHGNKSQERQQEALDFLDTKEQKIRRITPGVLFTFAGMLFMVTAIVRYQTDKKTQRVNKQVEAYEKTLPADYMEYKQAVEHYRDSLMNAKGR